MHDDPAPSSDGLPTLERARAVAARGGLADPDSLDSAVEMARTLAREPAESRRLAAILFAADILRREAWEEEVELAPALFDRYPRGMPETPSDYRATGYQLLDMGRATKRGRCSLCFLSPGTVICARCFGKARDDEGPCQYCNGETVTCSACEGTGETVRATVRHINDRPVTVRRAFLPLVPDTLSPALRSVLEAVHDPPESRRFALQANVVESAYRGASAVRAPEFRGHEFGVALGDALEAAHEVDRYSDVVRRDVRAYAWPVLVLRFARGNGAGDAWFAVVDDAAGTLRVLGVDSAEHRRTT